MLRNGFEIPEPNLSGVNPDSHLLQSGKVLPREWVVTDRSDHAVEVCCS